MRGTLNVLRARRRRIGSPVFLMHSPNVLHRFFLASALLVAGLAARAETWDVVIRNGTIVDGSGRPGFVGNVALKNGRVAQVGAAPGDAKQQIDATGLVVAPGFIDVHTHAEGILESPDAENFIRMGVTTVIVGNCGASEHSLGGYFHLLESTNIAINVASLIGHNAVRGDVMGMNSARPPTADEMARMQGMVEQAMRDGALGFSTGLIYSPGKFSQTDEIVELAKVAARYQGIYATHVRDEQEGLLASLEEAFKVGRRAQIPVELSHLKLSGNLISPQKAETVSNLEKARGEGLVKKVIAALESAQKEGLKVTQDLYPYSAATAFINRLLPPEAVEGGEEQLPKRLADPALRAKYSAWMKQQLAESGHANYAHAVIVTARRYKRLQGLTVVQATQERRHTVDLNAQIDLILEIAGNGGASIILYDFNEEDLLPLMLLPGTMFISDSGTFLIGNEIEHPRGYGSAARVLRKYVREGRQLPMEAAVRQMTGLPAATFHLKDRGELKPGAWADIVVFDPAAVRDQADFASPHLCATGFRHIFVNGREAVRDDRLTGARAGRVVRRGE